MKDFHIYGLKIEDGELVNKKEIVLNNKFKADQAFNGFAKSEKYDAVLEDGPDGYYLNTCNQECLYAFVRAWKEIKEKS